MEDVAGQEGMRINDRWSVLSDFDMHAIFDDATVYTLDSKILGVTGQPNLLPRPRSSVETLWTNAYRMHQDGLPPITGFFQVRNARGQVSIPSQALILTRNTYDYNFNTAINPVLHLGRNSIAFNTGVQYTVRRDHYNRTSEFTMNQNLFRQFVYMSTSSFGNWISIHGTAFHEAGPFTERSLTSRDLGARLEFTVGRPWGNTALITGYSVRDLVFHPLIREFFSTSTYAGLQRSMFHDRVKVTALGEYIRAWRVQDLTYAIAQSIRPAAEVQIQATKHWSADASFAYSRGEGFHDYDNIASGFFISYLKPLHRTLDTGAAGQLPVEYPLRFSIGIQQDEFPNFAGRGQAIFRPVFRLTLF
jgi:hypothetical protein